MAFKSLKKKYQKLKLKWQDAADLKASKQLDISGINTVCLALGPYRNLTTLTASVLFLHPNCQVLNHGGARIFGNPSVDFLSSYSKDKLDAFIAFALTISGKGERGGGGGSITHSHAFDDKHKLKDIYAKSSVAQGGKSDIQSLFWKESLHTSNLLQNQGTDVAALLAQEPRLRFLMPIRNPLDCAVSNQKTGHVGIFRGLKKDAPLDEVLVAILDEIYWFAALKQANPDRFFSYFEHSVNDTMLHDMAAFLQLSPDPEWLSNALAAMEINSSYQHSPELITLYTQYVDKQRAAFPELSAELLKFVAS